MFEKEYLRQVNEAATKQVNEMIKTEKGRTQLGPKIAASFKKMQDFLDEHKCVISCLIVDAKPQGYFAVRALLNDHKYSGQTPVSCILGDMTGAMTDLLRFFNVLDPGLFVLTEVAPASFTTNLAGYCMYAQEPKKPTWVIEIPNGPDVNGKRSWLRLKLRFDTIEKAQDAARAMFDGVYRVVSE